MLGEVLESESTKCRICGIIKPNTEFSSLRTYNRHCKPCGVKRSAEYFAKNREREIVKKREWYAKTSEQRREKDRLRRFEKRLSVIQHYGGLCACCGEKEYKFLAIDHINGGGDKHRRALGPAGIVNWLIMQGFPEGFQILCHNCNSAKGFYGSCPHVAG